MMPRDIGLETVEVNGKYQSGIHWEALVSRHFEKGFYASIYSEDYGENARKEHFCYEGEETKEESLPPVNVKTEPSANSTNGDIKQEIAGSTNSKSSATPSELVSSTPLWQGTTDCRSRTLQLDPLIPKSLEPGKRYIAILRANMRCFYGQPFPFATPYPAPQNVQVKRVGSTYSVIVTWDFPSVIKNPRFIVTCSSIDGSIYQLEGIKGTSHTFQVDGDALGMDLVFTVKAVSKYNIASVETSREWDADIERICPSTSPSPCGSTNFVEPFGERNKEDWEDRGTRYYHPRNRRSQESDFEDEGFVGYGCRGDEVRDDGEDSWDDTEELAEAESDDDEGSTSTPEHVSKSHPDGVCTQKVFPLLFRIDSCRRLQQQTMETLIYMSAKLEFWRDNHITSIPWEGSLVSCTFTHTLQTTTKRPSYLCRIISFKIHYYG
jgi:hypothetical protein